MSDSRVRKGKKGALAFACAFLTLSLVGCGRDDAVSTSLSEARSAMDAGDYDTALGLLSTLVESESGDLEVRRAYGEALAASGDSAAALEQYAEALAISAEDTATLYAIAILERTTGSVDAAIGHLEQLVEVDPAGANLDELARTYMQVGRFEEAAGAWGRALKDEGLTVPQRIAYLIVQADALQNAKRYDEARKALEEAVFLAPNDEALRARLEGLGN